jgi:hypothetical protein
VACLNVSTGWVTRPEALLSASPPSLLPPPQAARNAAPIAAPPDNAIARLRAILLDVKLDQ